MTDFKFKEGDRVYFPAATNKVLQMSSDFIVSYLDTDGDNHNVGIKSGGKFYSYHHNPAFFPATQEWYDKLVTVYPHLEKPPARKDLKEITIVVLDGSYRLIKALEDVDGELIFE